MCACVSVEWWRIGYSVALGKRRRPSFICEEDAQWHSKKRKLNEGRDEAGWRLGDSFSNLVTVWWCVDG
jgi:hypothetical protein